MIQQSHPWAYVWKDENSNSTRYMYPNVCSNTVYNSQDMEADEVFISKWVDKKEIIYTHTHIYKLNHFVVCLKHCKSTILKKKRYRCRYLEPTAQSNYFGVRPRQKHSKDLPCDAQQVVLALCCTLRTIWMVS